MKIGKLNKISLILTLLLGLGLTSFGFIFSLSAYIHDQVGTYIYTNSLTIPNRDIAIVFGAEVNSKGTPSMILADRIAGAIQLYKAGKVKKILMTGDNTNIYYNEIIPMLNYALKRGIPRNDILLDYAGVDTYDSCYRAKNFFKVHKAILVTQKYHLYRALYTCRTLGISAIGYGLEDWSKYPGLDIPYTIREYLANIKALWQLDIAHDRPQYPEYFKG